MLYRRPNNQNKNISIDHLREENIQQNYRKGIQKDLQKIDRDTNQKHWTTITKICIDNSEKLKPKLHKNKPSDTIIEELSNQQKQIKLRIEHTIGREEIKKLKKERNSILRKIHTIIKKKEEEKLLSKIKDIEQSKNDSRRMFKAIQLIHKTSGGNIIVEIENRSIYVHKSTRLVPNPNIKNI